MKTVRHLYILALVFAPLLNACSFLEIPVPKDQLVRGNVYTSDQSATAVISGIYHGLIEANGQLGNLNIVTELSADQLLYAGNDNGYMQFFENNIDESNGIIQNLWTAFYRNIYRCNAALEGLAGATGLSTGLTEQLRGEVLTIRAFCYFYLVNLWGDVPLLEGQDYRVNQRIGRTPQANILATILADLQEAEVLLSDTYPSLDRARINQRAVQALLARVHWMNGNWHLAASAATRVIDDSDYVLENPEMTFTLRSRETIWQLIPFNLPAQAPTYIPNQPGIIPAYYIAPQFVDDVEQGDQRTVGWIEANFIGGVSYHYPYKYKVASGNNPTTEALSVFRLAEQYLIRAEARVMMGDEIGAQADVNAIRARAGLDALDGHGEALLTAIAGERRIELFAEWGLRWLDLKRSATAEEFLSPLNPRWQPVDLLWPLPLAERQRNPNLEPQNDGY